jgi:hypothetical protein
MHTHSVSFSTPSSIGRARCIHSHRQQYGVQSVSLSIACSVDVQGVSLSIACRVDVLGGSVSLYTFVKLKARMPVRPASGQSGVG